MADKEYKYIDKEKLDAAFDAIDLFNPNIQTTLDKIEEYNSKKKQDKKLEEAIQTASDNINLQSEKAKKNILELAEENNEVSLSTSVSNAIVSGGIKIPYGWAQLTAEIMDAIGDMVVVLTNLAHLENTTIEACIEQAYKVISKRTGKMINGTFVKDEN